MSKARKNLKANALSKEKAKKAWAALESVAPLIQKQRAYQDSKDASGTMDKLQRKKRNIEAQSIARANRDKSENKICETERKGESGPKTYPRCDQAVESSGDEVSSDYPHSESPPKRLFNYEKVTIKRRSINDLERSQLPVIRHECEIMEGLFANADKTCVLICGDTGTGKTTQVPQFLLEYGFPAMIGITQPRRVAVYAMAARLREELGVTDEVGYQVRHEKVVDKNLTKIKFMTEGILLREIQQDFALRQYSALIIDEVHERSVDCDILLGLLSRIIPLRYRMGYPLAVILMSATIDISIFTKNSLLFPNPPPVINIESRRFELSEHYSLHSCTLTSYIDDAFEKCVQIHTRLPHGGILCFVPTQKDCEILAMRLSQYFQKHSTRPYRSRDATGHSLSRKEKHDMSLENTGDGEMDLQSETDMTCDEDIFDLNEEGQVNEPKFDTGSNQTLDTLYALPLYASMDDSRQRLVFSKPPDGKRLCVIATNVAETSLTIPDVRYVVDTGFVKERNYDADSNTFRSKIVRVSLGSARQRAGRAGRTMPGHVYRLYTPGCYGQFPASTKPEIERTPIERVVLFLSSFNVNTLKFPFPTSVSGSSIFSAINRLEFLGALHPKTGNAPGKITDLGRELIQFPIVPRLAVILLQSVNYSDIVRHLLIDAVAVASSTIHLFQPSEENSTVNHPFVCPGSDYLSYAKFLDAFRHSKKRKKLCRDAKVSYAIARDSYMLSSQLHRVLGVDANHSEKLNKNHQIAFRKALCKGFLDCVAKKLTTGEVTGGKAVYVHNEKRYRLHPLSQCVKVRPFPEWILFSSIESVANRKDRLCGLTIVTIDWLMEMGYRGFYESSGTI